MANPIVYTAYVLIDGTTTVWARSRDYDSLAARFDAWRSSKLAKDGIWPAGYILSFV